MKQLGFGLMALVAVVTFSMAEVAPDGKCGEGKCETGKCGQGKCASGKCGGGK
jgi:uncharacterized low-complexity protein